MLARTLYDESVELLARLGADGKVFYDTLSEWAKYYSDLQPSIVGTAEGGAKINEHASRLNNTTVEASKLLKSFKLTDFVRSADAVRSTFNQYAVADGTGHVQAGLIADQVHQFSELLDQFARVQRPEHAIQVLLAADELLQRIDVFGSTLQGIVLQLRPQPVQDGEIVSIHFPGDHDLTEISRKLAVLDAICGAIEKLLANTPDQSTFRIYKIETGSLIVELIGGGTAAFLLRRFIIEAGKWVYRTYFEEGQLRYGVPDRIKAIEEAIKLDAKLTKAGHQSEQLEQGIQMMSGSLARHLSDLLRTEDEVRLDGQNLHHRGGFFDAGSRGLGHHELPSLGHRVSHDERKTDNPDEPDHPDKGSW